MLILVFLALDEQLLEVARETVICSEVTLCGIPSPYVHVAVKVLVYPFGILATSAVQKSSIEATVPEI